jgi:DNA-binding NarL/FixJ family response regulator
MASIKRIAIIADVDVYFRMAVSGLLTRELGFSEVVEAVSFDAATEYLREHPEVTIAIMDLSTAGMGANVGLRIIRECFRETKLAVVANSDIRRNVLSALEAGVHGFLPKNLSIADMTTALRQILAGEIYVPKSLAEVSPRLPQSVIELSEFRSSSTASAKSPLTPRQRDVLELLVQGKPNKEIASALHLGEGTVKIHVAAIFRHFGVNNRAAAAVAYARPRLGPGPLPSIRGGHEASAILAG